MFIDEVRARRDGDEVRARRDGDEVRAPGDAGDQEHAGVSSPEYQDRGHLHPSYMEWFSHNEDSYFR